MGFYAFKEKEMFKDQTQVSLMWVKK